MIIAPSLLAADHGRFADETRRVHRAKADWLHLDIMDGHFVENISFGPEVVRKIRPLTKIFFDVHLMCTRPEILLHPFAQAGADNITVHVELGEKVTPLLWKVKSLGKKVGLAINPPTSIAHVLPYLEQIDLLLIMTVNPGFGGQQFLASQVPKIEAARARITASGRDVMLEVDGGITPETAKLAIAAGADVLVAGSAVFHAQDPNGKGRIDYAGNIARLRG
jgi:ribulose-phosphate 3-epimerase